MKTFVFVVALALVLAGCATVQQAPVQDAVPADQEVEQVASDVEGITADLDDVGEIDALDQELAELENVDLE